MSVVSGTALTELTGVIIARPDGGCQGRHGTLGAVLADGEVVGTSRPRAAGTKLTLAVTAFDDGGWPGLDEEAERVAAARGLRLVDVRTEPS